MTDESSKGPGKPRPGSSPRRPRPGGGKPPDGRPPRPRKNIPSRRTPSQGRPGQSRRPQSLRSNRQFKRTYHLIVNQAAGNDPENSVKLAKKLDRRLKRANLESIIHLASTWDEYTQAVLKTLREHTYATIIFGGDGSIRMAASRVARVKGLLGIVPCGRYNNIFRSLYGHVDAEAALDIVQSEHQMRIDAGLANGKFFLGSLVTGVVPALIARLEGGKLPRLSMMLSKMAARATDETAPLTTVFKVDSYTFKAQPVVLNIQLLPYLMSLRFAPAATPEDGHIILIYDRDGTRDSVAHYIRDLKKDRYQYTENFQMLRGKRISISPASGRVWLMDGDSVEFTGEEIGIEVLHQILRVFANAPKKD